MEALPKRVGTLSVVPVRERMDLVADPVRTGLTAHALLGLGAAEIDPETADTAAFCDTYGVLLEDSANCVVVAAKRGGEVSFAACVLLASTRADVNGVVRRHLSARKVSFAPMEEAVAETRMEYGGITPIGLPSGWPILIDAAVAAHPLLVVGSGLRRSKLVVPGAVLASLPGADVLSDLAR